MKIETLMTELFKDHLKRRTFLLKFLGPASLPVKNGNVHINLALA